MRKVNLNEIKKNRGSRPGGKYAVSFKGISEALGREPSSLDLAKRHPFDLEWNQSASWETSFSLSRAFGAMGVLFSRLWKRKRSSQGWRRLRSCLATRSSSGLTNRIN